MKQSILNMQAINHFRLMKLGWYHPEILIIFIFITSLLTTIKVYQDVNCIIFCCMLADHELRKLSIPVSCKPLCVHQMRASRCQLHSSNGDDMQGLYIHVHMCMHL